jgi:hypothetical protein
MNTGLFQNQIPSLPTLSRERYENIFRLYNTDTSSGKSTYFYNILTKVQIPDTLDENLIGNITPTSNMPWTTLSYKLYGSIFLWWLIFLLNKPDDIFTVKAGVTYKYILPNYIDSVLESIQNQLTL